jgi:hypothetical protein
MLCLRMHVLTSLPPTRLRDLHFENIIISLIWLLQFIKHENILSVGSPHAREMHIGSPG